jgi:hypothetical protein
LSEHRRAVEIGIAAGFTAAALSRDYGLGSDAILRHAKAHLPTRLADAEAAQELVEADELLMKVAELEADARRIGGATEEAGDARTALMAVDKRLRIVELLAKLGGRLPAGGPVAVAIALSTVPAEPTDEQVQWARKVLTARIEREEEHRHG